MQSLIAACTVVFLLAHAFDSLLRWLLDFVHLGPLIYARDLGMVAAILLGYVDLAERRRPALAPFAVLGFFVLGCVIGLASGLSLNQVLFGVKVWLPLLFGYMVISSGAAPLLHRPRLWLSVWALLVGGVIVNMFVTYPWSGMLVKVGDVDVMVNREWTTGGLPRLSGFSRASYDAALFIALLAFYLMVALRSPARRAGIWLLSGAAVVLTTTKGVVGVFAIASLLIPVIWSLKPHTRGTATRLLAGGTVTAAALVGLVAPLTASQIPLPQFELGTAEHTLFASFVERGWSVWPAALGLLESWQLLAGRGIGGIGAAQSYFEPLLYSPADNLFVYCYITVGLVGAVCYVYLAACSWRLPLAQAGGRLCFCILLLTFLYGVTSNIIESAGGLIAIGATTAYLTQQRRLAHAHA